MPSNAIPLHEKLALLQHNLAELKSVAVAFSGGVDSALLLYVAHEVLGEDAVAITAQSPTFPERELAEATQFCQTYGIAHLTCKTNELELENFRHNPTNRCYLCKHNMFEQFSVIAQQHNLAHIVEGSNVDDEGDYRPGSQAIAELDIKSPLKEAGLTKADIRALSQQMGLPTWNKPSFACLSSRFVYGDTITESKLSMVDQAEQFLLDLGFSQVRVRIHETLARIEVVPEELNTLMQPETREAIVHAFKAYGFTYITADLIGYRTGSMNETL